MKLFTLIVKILYYLRLFLILKTKGNRYNSNSKSYKKIVLYTIRNYENLLDIELYLANLLSRTGAKVYVVFDRGTFKHWDTMQFNENCDFKKLNPYTDFSIQNIIRNYILFPLIRKVYKTPNIEYLYIDKMGLNLSEKTEEFETLIAKHSISSSRRFFQKSDINQLNYKEKLYYDLSNYNSKVSLLIGGKIENDIKPDHFITSHGIYSLYGPCFEYLKSKKVNVKVYAEHAYVNSSLLICEDNMQTMADSKSWCLFKKRDIHENEKKKVQTYLEERLNFCSRDTNFYCNNDTKFYYDIPKDKKVFGLFPNVIWDGDIVERDYLFDNIIEWVVETIDAFRCNNNFLIIRFHPAENSLFKDTVKFEEIIRSRIKDVDSINNVLLISSSSKLNSYELVKKYVDVCMVYDGMIGFESVFLGKPIVALGKGRCLQSEISPEFSSKDCYFDLLADPSSFIRDFSYNKNLYLDKAVKYLYWYIYINAFYIKTLPKDAFLNNKMPNGVKGLTKSDFDLDNSKVEILVKELLS